MAEVQEYLKAETPQPPAEIEEELADPEVSAQRQALTILAGLLFEEPQAESEEQSKSLGMSAITRGQLASEAKAGGRPVVYRYLGQAIDLQTRGNKKKAARELERAIGAGLEHPAAHYNLGVLYKELGDYDEARKQLIAAVGHPELALGANLALGRLSRLQDDLVEAARYLLQALRLAENLLVDESQSAELNRFYDTILASQSDGDEEGLSRIVENTLSFLSGPEWLHRLRQARQQLETQGAGSPVAPIAGMLAVAGTERVVQAMGRIDDLIAQGHLNAAMEEAMLALGHAPHYLPLHRRMAEILIQDGHDRAGHEKLVTIAETHQVRGEIQQAADMYAKILEYDPVDAGARAHLITLLAQQDRTEEALAQYMELAELYRQLAEIDSARRTLAEALKLAKRTSVSSKWSLKILHQMGDIDLSRLEWHKALDVYQQIRSLDPDDDKARTNVIDLNLRLGQEDQAAEELDSYLEHLVKAGRGSEALELLEAMVREHPGKQALHSRLAEAYRAAGRKADAIAQYDALGEIQLDAGQVQNAIQTIQTIIDLGPPDAEGYLELLRNLRAGQ
jgi:tetratricopeptide (TPR) repeat protein